MVQESKYCSRVIKKHFRKEFVVAKENDGSFKSSTKCWIPCNTFVKDNVKERGHCPITGKYRDDAYGEIVVFCNLKNYDAHYIMQKLGTFGFKINTIPNGLEKHMNFILDNKLAFSNSFQFLSSSLDSLI